MTIRTTVSAGLRAPGTYFEFNTSAAQRGLTPLTQRIALIGAQSSAATKTVNTVNQIFTEAEADEYWGKGSELALMARWALKATLDYGKSPEIWGVGIAEPGAGAANVSKFTMAGTATADGDLHVRVAGRDVHVAVTSGDLHTEVSLLLEDAIDELVAELPVTAGESGGVVSLTHVTKGVNGLDVELDVITTPAGLTCTAGSTTAGSGAADPETALANLLDKDYDVVALGNHASADVTDCATHLTAAWAAGQKRWRHTLMAERGTLATAQALATAADDFKQIIVSAEGFRNTPSEIAAYIGTLLAAEDDPALPFNGVECPSLYPPEKADIPTNAEIESGISGGLFMLTMNEAQTKPRIIRAVTTQVTDGNSNPFFAMLDYTIGRSMYFGARQIDIALSGAAFARAKKTARVQRAIRSAVLEKMYALEELEIWQNIDEHADELEVETDAVVTTRCNVAVPTSVVPPLNQIVPVMNLIIE